MNLNDDRLSGERIHIKITYSVLHLIDNTITVKILTFDKKRHIIYYVKLYAEMHEWR